VYSSRGARPVTPTTGIPSVRSRVKAAAFRVLT